MSNLVNRSAIEALEGQLAEAKELAERRQLADKLWRNRDFRKLIVDGFMRDEAARMVGISTDPALKENERADALGLAQAAGHLRRWLSMQMQMGAKAEGDMAALEAELDAARSEEVEADTLTTEDENA